MLGFESADAVFAAGSTSSTQNPEAMPVGTPILRSPMRQ